MKLEQDPIITEGPSLIFTLKRLFRVVAQAVNTNVDAASSGAAAAVVLAAPPGMVGTFLGPAAPSGWLKANGAAISRTVYAALFAQYGTTFGVGNGTTTFNLPDLRGEFPRFTDDLRGVDPGRGVGSWQGEAILSHNHSLPIWTSEYEAAGYGLSLSSSFLNRVLVGGGSVVASNYSGGPETRPRNVALLACVKY